MWTSGATFLSYIDRLHNDDDDGDVKRRSLAFIPQHTRTYTNEHRRTHTYTQSQTHTCSLTSHTRMHPHTRTRTYAYRHIHTYARTLSNTHARARKHACMGVLSGGFCQGVFCLEGFVRGGFSPFPFCQNTS